MKLRTVLIPVALLAALAFVTADDAQAAPLSAKHTSKAFFGPKVFVGGGIGFDVPLGRRTVVHRSRVVRPRGYWRTVPETVWVPARVIGYDAYGHAIVSPGYHKTIYRRVWVEAPVVVRRRAVVRPRVHVGIGTGFIFR